MMVSEKRVGNRADYRTAKQIVFGWRDDGLLSDTETKEALAALKAVKANEYAVRRVKDKVESLVYARYEAAEKKGAVL